MIQERHNLRFGQVFWGLLLVILDFNANRIDVLPDFVGYILVAVGSRGLKSASRHFSTASTMSWVLVVFAIIGYSLRGDAADVFGLMRIAMDCAMIWFLLGGVMDLATVRQRADICERASNRRVAYVALMGVAALAGFFVWNSGAAPVFAVVIWVICLLLLLILILHLIHRAGQELT